MKNKSCSFFIFLIVVYHSVIAQAMLNNKIFLDAVENGRLEEVQKMLGQDPNLIGSVNSSQETAMHLIVKKKYKKTLLILISAGADLNARNSKLETPLHWAVEHNNQEAVKTLIKKGARVDLQDEKGCTPLSWAVQNKLIPMIQVLIGLHANPGINDLQGLTPLYWAVELRCPDIIDILIKDDTVLNGCDQRGVTPILWALQQGNKNFIQILLDKKVDLNARGIHGYTPLHWVSQSGNVEAIKYFLSQGAQLEAQDNGGRTPLHWAAQSRNWRAVKSLIAQGAQLEARDNEGCTPLHWAVQNDNQHLVEFLIMKGGAQREARDKNNNTPLILAAKKGIKSSVESLIKSGVDLDAQDDYGRTALLWAAGSGNGVVGNAHESIAEILIQKNAKIDIEDYEKNTPLYYIIMNLNGFFLKIYKQMSPELRTRIYEILNEKFKFTASAKDREFACRGLYILTCKKFKSFELLGINLDNVIRSVSGEIAFAHACAAPLGDPELFVLQNNLQINPQRLGDLEPLIKNVPDVCYDQLMGLIKAVLKTIENEKLEHLVKSEQDLKKKLALQESSAEELEKIFVKIETSLSPYFDNSHKLSKSIIKNKLMLIAQFLIDLSKQESAEPKDRLFTEVEILAGNCQHCRTRAQEGIEYLYNRLVFYQLNSSELQAGKNFHPLLDSMIRQIKNDLVDNKMFSNRQIVRQNSQRVHLTCAIRSILGQDIGLWAVGQKFSGDLVQTNDIEDALSLLGVPRCSEWKGYLFQEFLSYYRPNDLITAFQAKVNSWLMSESKNFNKLVGVFTEGGIVEISENYFDEQYLLTREGSTALLLAYGYLSQGSR